MPKAKEVAAELMSLASKLEAAGEMEVPYAFMVFHFYTENKDSFVAFAKDIMPRPYKKEYESMTYSNDIRLKYAAHNENNQEVISLWAKIDRKSICRLVKPAQPAVYDCDPIFSQEEEEEIGVEK